MTDIVEILGTTVPVRTAVLAQLSALAEVVGHLVPHNVRHCWRAIVMEQWLQCKQLPAPVVKLIASLKFARILGAYSTGQIYQYAMQSNGRCVIIEFSSMYVIAVSDSYPSGMQQSENLRHTLAGAGVKFAPIEHQEIPIIESLNCRYQPMSLSLCGRAPDNGILQ